MFSSFLRSEGNTSHQKRRSDRPKEPPGCCWRASLLLLPSADVFPLYVNGKIHNFGPKWDFSLPLHIFLAYQRRLELSHAVPHVLAATASRSVPSPRCTTQPPARSPARLPPPAPSWELGNHGPKLRAARAAQISSFSAESCAHTFCSDRP